MDANVALQKKAQLIILHELLLFVQALPKPWLYEQITVFFLSLPFHLFGKFYYHDDYD